MWVEAMLIHQDTLRIWKTALSSFNIHSVKYESSSYCVPLNKHRQKDQAS